jgi:hypothetical protein
MQDKPGTLAALLRQAAEELGREQAPPLPRAAVAAPPALAASRWSRLPRWAIAGALAASVAWLVVLRPPTGEPARADESGAFVSVVGGERWARLGSEDDVAWVVPSELSAARLSAFGLPYDPARAADLVRAELLLHANGEVLAVRLLPDRRPR